MKEQNEEPKTNISEVISKSELFFEKNKKVIISVIVAILVVILGYFGLKKFYFQPREVEAQEEIFYAENLYSSDQYETALNGDEDHMGFAEIADKYSCTKAGNLAKYYAGICELRLGNFENAITFLNKYKGKDDFTTINKLILIGDAEIELGNQDAAIKSYKKAVDADKENFVTAPMALYKIGMIYTIKGDYKEAAKYFNEIKKNYPESTEMQDIDKYIGYAESCE